MEIDHKKLIKFFEKQPGCKWQNKHDRTWILHKDGKIVMVVKKIRNQSKAIAVPFNNIHFLTSNFRFTSQKQHMEMITVRGDWRKSTPQEVLETGIGIYNNINNILVVQTPIKMPKDILALDAVLDSQYPAPSKPFAQASYKKLLNNFDSVEKCGRGFFHGDLHCPNVLVDGDQKYVIDFDDISIAPSVLNIAQPYYIENLKKHLLSVEGYDWDRIGDITNTFLGNLKQPDKTNFWKFVRLCGYYWETRTIPMRIKGLDERHADLERWFYLIDDVVGRMEAKYKS